MELQKSKSKAFLFYGIGLTCLLLCAKSAPWAGLVACLAAGFFLTGAAQFRALLIPFAAAGAAVVWWRTGSLLYAAAVLILILCLVYGQLFFLNRKASLEVLVGVPALAAAGVLLICFSLYIFQVRQSLDFSGILPSLQEVKDSLDEALYPQLLALGERMEAMGDASIGVQDRISQVLTMKNELVEMFYSQLAGLAMGGLFVGSYLTHGISRLLLQKQGADLSSLSLRRLHIPLPVGALFLLAIFVELIGSGLVGQTAANLTTALELPFMVCGIFVAYDFLEQFTVRRFARVLIGILIGLTVLGVPISLGVLYLLLGVADSLCNLRERIARRRPEMRALLHLDEDAPQDDDDDKEEK